MAADVGTGAKGVEKENRAELIKVSVQNAEENNIDKIVYEETFRICFEYDSPIDVLTAILLKNDKNASILKLIKDEKNQKLFYTEWIEIPLSEYAGVNKNEEKEDYNYKIHQTENAEKLTLSVKIKNDKRDVCEVFTFYRNYEEWIGINKNETEFYEDFFIKKGTNVTKVVNEFIEELYKVKHTDIKAYNRIEELVEKKSAALWQAALDDVKSDNLDDRPLYWGRNKMQVFLKRHPLFKNDYDCDKSTINDNSDLQKLITLFEEKSRNYTGIDFSGASVGAKKILIIGFDPFFLNEKHPLYGQGSNIKQSNPSGVCALALHEQNLGNGYVQTMIVPVRYTDFDSSKDNKSGQGEGIIEDYIKEWLSEVDMIITVSQALPNQYNIDVFATATRGGTIDNMNFTREEGSKSVNISSPETIVTTLPDEFTQAPSEAIFNGKYQLSKYESPLIATKNNYPTTKVFNGPGGNYLSNEIFYRVAKLRKDLKPTLRTGHFHIAKLQNENIKEDFNIGKTQNLLNIVKIAINKGISEL